MALQLKIEPDEMPGDYIEYDTLLETKTAVITEFSYQTVETVEWDAIDAHMTRLVLEDCKKRGWDVQTVLILDGANIWD